MLFAMRRARKEHMEPQDTYSGLKARVIETTSAFEALEGDWRDLYRDAPQATPFQSFGWLFSWWRNYAEEDASLALKLIELRERESDLLVGLAPLVIERAAPSLRILKLLGSGVTDYGDLLVRQGREREVFDAFAEEITALPGWNVADLRQLRPGSPVFGAIERLKLPRTVLVEDGYPTIEASSWEEAIKPVSGNLRSMARRSVRRLAAEGIECVPVVKGTSPEMVEAAARRFVALHREYWRDRGISPEHLKDRFERHLVSAALGMVPEGSMQIREFIKGEEGVVASQVLVLREGYVGHLLSGARPEVMRKYQISSVFVYDGFAAAETLGGARVFDFLRGEEPYKLRWTGTVRPGRRVVLARSPYLVRLYAGSVRLLVSLKGYARSEAAPAPVRKARKLLNALR